MQAFRVRSIAEIVGRESHMRALIDNNVISGAKAVVIADEHRPAIRGMLHELEADFSHLGLVASSATLGRIRALIERPDATYVELQDQYREYVGRFLDETSAIRMLALDSTNARFFSDPDLFGAQVSAHFPGALIDIEEAGKCLALSRNTACVFHVMRVMEVGLRALASSLNEPKLDPDKNPTWENVLKRGDAELQRAPDKRSPEWRTKPDFFSDAIACLRAVKTAWRNPTMHVRGNYDSEKALDIFNAARGLMRHLATGLKEAEAEDFHWVGYAPSVEVTAAIAQTPAGPIHGGAKKTGPSL